MNNEQTVLTALGCASSLAAMLTMTGPAMASSATTALDNSNSFDYGLSLVQSDSDPLTDALSCKCAVCTGGVQRPIF